MSANTPNPRQKLNDRVVQARKNRIVPELEVPIASVARGVVDSGLNRLLLDENAFDSEGRLKAESLSSDVILKSEKGAPNGVATLGSNGETIFQPVRAEASFTAEPGRFYVTVGTLTVTNPPVGQIVVTGAGTAAANGTYLQVGHANGRPRYERAGTCSVYWSETQWWIYNDDLSQDMYRSNDNVAHPGLVTTWFPVAPGVAPVPHVVSTVPPLPSGAVYGVLVTDGTTTINGVAFAPSRHPVWVNFALGGSWSINPNRLSSNLELLGTNNTAPNQTATSASSLMTRGLTHQIVRPIFSAPRALPWQFSEIGYFTANGASHAANGGRRRLVTTATTDSCVTALTQAVPINASNLVFLGVGNGLRYVGSLPLFSENWLGLFYGTLPTSPGVVGYDPLDAEGFSAQFRLNSGVHQYRLVHRIGGTTTATAWANYTTSLIAAVAEIVVLRTSSGYRLVVRELVGDLWTPTQRVNQSVTASLPVFSAAGAACGVALRNVGTTAANPHDIFEVDTLVNFQLPF